MTTWIALLRGVNVGGKHRVSMKTLVSLMETKGFADVKTYIQSGNLVLRHPTRPKDEIGLLIQNAFGFKPEVFILSKADLLQSLANNPYQVKEGKHLHFFFCDKTPKTLDYAFLESLRIPSEEYQLIGNVFYFHTPEGIGRSKLAEKMGRAFPGISMTARNLNTLNKLAEMLK